MWQVPLEALLAFGFTWVLVFGLARLFRRPNESGLARFQEDIPAPPAKSWFEFGQKVLLALPVLGNPLLPKKDKERGLLEHRLRRAGIFHPQALLIFLGVKTFLVMLGITVGLICLLPLSPTRAMWVGFFACGFGLILPGLWLERKIAARAALMRRGLPDALDMMVLCMEGGLSLNGALQRVRGELESVHPQLTAEMSIVEREMLMGVSVAEALKKMADRLDLEELRNLAAVLMQSQRYGASMVKALRVFADTLRQERQQQAEERAQKAAVKILFPTLLCIFPAIFVVILGPAAFQLRGLLGNVK